jgi:hypothetical protein
MPRQRLGDRQGEQFGVGQLGGDPDRGPPWAQARIVLQGLVDLAAAVVGRQTATTGPAT